MDRALIKFSRIRKIIAILLIQALVIASTAFIVSSSMISTGNYYLEVPLSLADVYVGIFSNGSAYAINGSNWDCFSVNTNHTTVINTALSSLNDDSLYQRKIWLNGNFSVSGTLTIYNFTHWQLTGSIYQTRSNYNLITNNDVNNTVQVIIEGGSYYGKADDSLVDDTNSTGHGIFWSCAEEPDLTWTRIPTVWFKNLRIESMDSNGLHVNLTAAAAETHIWVTNVHSRFCDGFGMFLYKVNDAIITASHFGGDVYGLYTEDGGRHKYSNNYFAAGVYLRRLVKSTFSGNDFEMSGKNTVHLRGCEHLQFSGGQVLVFGNGGETVYGIYLEGVGALECFNNTFTGLYIGRTASGTRIHTYGVYEADGDQNGNIFVQTTAWDIKTAGIILQGANSTASMCMNGSVWIG